MNLGLLRSSKPVEEEKKMPTTILERNYTTLAAATTNGLPRLIGQLNNIVPGSLSLVWIPSSAFAGSYYEYQIDVIGSGLQITRLHAQEILSDTHLPVTLTCTPPMANILFAGSFAAPGAAFGVDDWLQVMASGIGNMIVSLSGATIFITPQFKVTPPGKAFPWYVAMTVWAKNDVGYGGITIAGLDTNMAPGSITTNDGKEVFMPNGPAAIILPSAQTEQLLPDFEMGINNGSAIYSVSSNTLTEP